VSFNKPNLLFIFTDEQRFDTLGCYGNRIIQTPNLNALAERSVVFENAYVTQSVCTPSRSSILTGLYPHTNGCTANNIPLRRETPTIAEMAPTDYIRGYIGKWHLGGEVVAQHGFEHWVSIEDAYRGYYSKPEHLSILSDYHHYLVRNGYEPDVEYGDTRVFARTTAARLPEPFTKAAFVGQETSRFISENRDRPFMLYVNFLEPHMPFMGPFDDLYDPNILPQCPAFLKKPDERASLRHRLLAEIYTSRSFEGHDLTTAQGWLKVRAQYWGLVTLIDNAVGRILRTLAECGLDDRTIVVFTSDHGDMMGDHAILAKCVMYEEAVKAPLTIRVPWMSPRQVSGRISQIDLVPTLLELMGCQIPDHLEGSSRAAVVSGEESLDGNDVFFEWNGSDGVRIPGSDEHRKRLTGEETARFDVGPWRTIVTSDGWKLNLSPVDQCELYDLNNDPFEQDNLFEDRSQAVRIDDLTARIRAWQMRTNDTGWPNAG